MSDPGLAAPNAEQLSVIMSPLDAPAKVVAGAGTGKTKTMVWRYLRLVERGCSPDRIMAVTFTNKAAGELREKIIDALLLKGSIGSRIEMDAAWIGTFHGLAYRLLRENPYEFRFDRDITMIDDLELALFKQELLEDLRDGAIAGSAALEIEAISPERAFKLTEAVVQVIQTVRAFGWSPGALTEQCRRLTGHRANRANRQADPRHGQAEKEAVEMFCATYAEFTRRLSERKLLDFDGVLMTLRDGLTEHGGGDRWRQYFQHVIVDEFQDTNSIQLQLLSALTHKGASNLMVVGDPRQSIYGWRDADVKNLTDFAGHPYELTLNYRSNQTVLDLANHIIRLDPGNAADLKATNPLARAEAVQMYCAATAEEEALFVAAHVQRLILDGRRPSEIAILARVRRLPVAFEQELRRLNIPYVTDSGRGFFDREEVKDIIAYLRVLADPLDDAALLRTLQNPLVRMSDADVYALRGVSVDQSGGRENRAAGFWDRLTTSEVNGFDGLDPDQRTRLVKHLDLLRRLATGSGDMGLGEIIQFVLDETGYLRFVERDSDSQRRLANLRKLVRMASDFEARNVFTGIRRFVQYVDLHGELKVDLDEGDTAQPEAVHLLTIHKAKGLEFPVVFLVQVKPYRQWDMDQLVYDQEYGLVLKYMDEDTGKENEHPKYQDWKVNAKTPAALGREETRRLLYVAVTRARERVIISATRAKQSSWDALLEPGTAPAKDDFFAEMALFVGSGQDRGILLDREDGAALPIPVTSEPQLPLSPGPVLPLSSPQGMAGRTPPVLVTSASRIEAFEQCPLRYRFIYEWRLPGVPDDLWPVRPERVDDTLRAPPADLLGTLVHELLRRLHETGRIDESIEYVESEWMLVSVSNLPAQQAAGLWQSDIRPMIEGYRLLPVAGYATIATEQEFNLVHDLDGQRVLIHGYIDRICTSPEGNMIVVDYKTTRTIDAAVRQAYARQLEIYRLASAILLDRPAETVLIDLRRGREIDLRAEPRAALDDVLRDMLLSTVRSAPPSAPCWTCAYRINCPSSSVRSRMAAG